MTFQSKMQEIEEEEMIAIFDEADQEYEDEIASGNYQNPDLYVRRVLKKGYTKGVKLGRLETLKEIKNTFESIKFKGQSFIVDVYLKEIEREIKELENNG